MGVRTEEVIVRGTDRYTGELARMAAATRLFRNELDDSNRTGNVFQKTTAENEAASRRFGQQLGRDGKALDSYSNRLGLLTRAGLAVGPALAPIGGVALAGIGVVASTASLATVGLLGLVAASQGVGDALKAVQAADVEPTAANLEKAQQAMAAISPEARDFVRNFQQLRPVLADIRDAGAEEFFPGLSDSMDDVERAAPALERLMAAIGESGGEGIGGLISGAAGDTEFLDYLTTEVPDAMDSLIELTGTLSHGLSRLLMNLDPGTDGFLDWVNDVATGFDQWASSDKGREDVEAFLDYAATEGPKVQAFFVSLVDVITQISQAAAPLGGPTLEILTSLARILATIADSPLGTPLAAIASGLSAVSLATKGWETVAGSSLGQIFRDTTEVGAGFDAAAGKAKSFGTQVANLGVRAGFGAIALGYISDSNSIADSLGRSQDAAESTADSVTSLAYDLQQSNVGKWASDLGYDVNTLAQDIAKNGTSGEYYTRVMADLEEHSSGAGAALNSMAGQVLPFYTANADKAYDASHDLDTITGRFVGTQEDAAAATSDNRTALQQLADITGISADEFDGATDAAQDFSGALAELNGWLDRRAAMRDYADAVATFREGLSDGFDREDIGALDDTARSIASIVGSMRNAANREDFLSGAIGSLQTVARSAGPEARAEIQKVIGRLQGLRNANPKLRFDANDSPLDRKIKRAILGVKGLDKMKASPFVELYLGSLLGDVGRAGRSLDGLGKKRVRPSAELDLNPFTAPLTAAGGQLTGFGKRKAQPTADLNTAPFMLGLGSVFAGMNRLPESHTIDINVITHYKTTGKPSGHATGGMIGRYGGAITGAGGPTEDSIPIRASHGEYMQRAAAVRYYGPAFMDALNHMVIPKSALLGYAGGGQVGTQPMKPMGATRPLGDRGSRQVVVQASGPTEIRGTLQTPWGPAEVRGIAEEAAESTFWNLHDYLEEQAR